MKPKRHHAPSASFGDNPVASATTRSRSRRAFGAFCRFGWAITLAACTQDPPAIERVQAIDTRQAASLGSASAPASSPASAPLKTHHEPLNRRLCDREYTAKDAPRVSLPSSKWKAGSGALWVNLWAAWCKPCVAEIPELAEWSKEGGFSLLFVSLDDDEREWKMGTQKLGIDDAQKRPPLVTSTWLEPGKGRTQFLKPLGFLDTPNLPGQALVDKDGRLRCFRSGAIENDEKVAFIELMKTL
jgi:thiol-disulfide isomerase/thioredoxin